MTDLDLIELFMNGPRASAGPAQQPARRPEINVFKGVVDEIRALRPHHYRKGGRKCLECGISKKTKSKRCHGAR